MQQLMQCKTNPLRNPAEQQELKSQQPSPRKIALVSSHKSNNAYTVNVTVLYGV